MKIIFLTMAAAICVAAPAAAQPWQGRGNQQSIQLQAEIDAGVRSGAISQRELVSLRASLRQFGALERQLGLGGLTGRENASLRQRGNALRQQIQFASQTRAGMRVENGGRYDTDGRAGWDARYDSEHRAASDDRYNSDRDAAWNSGRQGNFAASNRFVASNRGDRFAGDVRIGQRASRRMVAMPDQYRGEFRDSEQVYYRYDSERVYEIDRESNLITRLFDLVD